MAVSKRVIGKAFTYLGLFLSGMGMLGILGPYMDLQRSDHIMAQVTGNDIAYRLPNTFAFRLQLKWTSTAGEQRTNITTPVHAATEEEARAAYRGKHLVPGQTYEFYADPEHPDRILPFKGYNWATFGKFLLIAVAGLVVFVTGMTIVRQDKPSKEAVAGKRK